MRSVQDELYNDLVRAAEVHGQDEGEMEVGDLQEALDAAISMLDDEQVATLREELEHVLSWGDDAE